MKKQLLHTPEGVRDIYNSEYQKKIKVQDKMHKVLEQYNYHDIQTPTFEFFDIFAQDKGSAYTNDMYKFFDREGHILVLRPDMTPPIARCVAKYYENEDLPIRLSYVGNTFMNNSRYQGKLKEITQLGAELVNDDSASADAEIIAMAIECLLAAGLKDFQIEIGQVEFFKGLMEASNVDQETEEEIRSLIENKNFFGLKALMDGLKMDEATKSVILQFDHLYGDLDIIKKAKTLTTNDRSIKALERLEELSSILGYYGIDQYVSYDLGMLNLYNYYTGIIFKGYTHGTGDALVKGGRYNNLLKKYGKEAPSIGFGFVIDELMLALSRQKIEIESPNSATMILYKTEGQKSAIELAGHFRKQGLTIELMRYSPQKSQADYIAYSKSYNIGGILLFEEASKVNVINIETGETNIVPLEEIRV